MEFKEYFYEVLRTEMIISESYVEDFTAWRASVQKVVREYCKMQKSAKDRDGFRNAVIAGLIFFGALTFGANWKIGGVVGGVVAVIVVLAHVGDYRSFEPRRFLQGFGPLPDELLGMLADAPDVPQRLKRHFAFELSQRGTVGWQQLAFVLDELSGIVENARARRASGAQRLMQFINPNRNEGS